ncbi:hypothetical protein DPMN_184196 [Dreissena polymorpha]|uniref:Uncharacterized protein n=1 Tax=Dreissena polymorpha TaxID=45954 RepID=A0A9D4DJW8_DREPO|nr:hypothetical protein DPMN_184196 [Dreissena polymorpha]
MHTYSVGTQLIIAAVIAATFMTRVLLSGLNGATNDTVGIHGSGTAQLQKQTRAYKFGDGVGVGHTCFRGIV